MTTDSPSPLRIISLGEASAGTLTWHLGGAQRLTLVVKAAFSLVADGDMTPRPALGLVPTDVHYDGDPHRSLRAVSDSCALS